MTRNRWTLWVLIAAAAGLTAWTLLTLRTHHLDWFDRLPVGRFNPDTTAGQVAAVIAGVTWPGVLMVGLWVVALWAWRHRFRKLAQALGAVSIVGWLVPVLLNRVIGRERPASAFAEHFTLSATSYPSTQAAMVVATAVMVGAATATSRQPRVAQLFWRVVCGGVVVIVALVRLSMGASYPTDVVAGWLLGITVAAGTLWACGVRTVPAWEIMRPLPPVRTTGGLAAVIYNPVKIVDEFMFRRHVADVLARRGWQAPLWLPTSPTDPGRAMAATAIAERVDRVLVAGGDGTVRVVCSALAHSGILVGLVPAGTANLLCRNLGIPLDEGRALAVAMDGDPYAIDLVEVRTDTSDEVEHFAVMGGIGLDAQVMSATNEDLKKAVKSAAYAVAVAQVLGQKPVDASVVVDGREVAHRPASLMLVGNVGEIQAGLQLFPRAAADDGLLDVLLTGPRGLAGWMRWGVERIYRQFTQNVDTHQGTSVRIEVATPLPYELDGDTMGRASVFEATVAAKALTVMMPKRRT